MYFIIPSDQSLYVIWNIFNILLGEVTAPCYHVFFISLWFPFFFYIEPVLCFTDLFVIYIHPEIVNQNVENLFLWIFPLSNIRQHS
jgi:hypothetical protein